MLPHVTMPVAALPPGCEHCGLVPEQGPSWSQKFVAETIGGHDAEPPIAPCVHIPGASSTTWLQSLSSPSQISLPVALQA